MKFLIFGDTHLGKQFDEKTFEFLKKTINKADRVIINGDFWDDTKTSFDEFVNSPWKDLFPILKKKKSVYIHGNHDLENKTDKRVYEFCDSVKCSCDIKLKNGKKLLIVHGHEQSLVTSLVYFFFKNKPMLLHYLTKPLDLPHKFIMKLSEMGLNVEKYINFTYRRSVKEKNEILATGHTHAPEISLNNNYINTGFIDNGFASFLMVEDGQPRLVRLKY